MSFRAKFFLTIYLASISIARTVTTIKQKKTMHLMHGLNGLNF
jgi:hypothetical protein